MKCMIRGLKAAFSIFFIVGCAQTPTKVYEKKPVKEKESSQSASLVITEQTVFLDARPTFEYAVSHLNGSIPVQVQDFSQSQQPFLGLLDPDSFGLARRLARMGIDPTTPVVVVGKGPNGNGEEGRMAWTLRYLGVKDVRFASIEAFSMPLSSNEAPPRENKPIWKPVVEQDLFITSAQFLKGMVIPKTSEKAPVIIDVRSEAAYLGKAKDAMSQKVPDVGGINIPWKEFFDDKGWVKASIKDRLTAVGVTPDKQVFVIGEQGTESAAVTMALRELGFAKAGNVAGGYLELLSKNKRSRK